LTKAIERGGRREETVGMPVSRMDVHIEDVDFGAPAG